MPSWLHVPRSSYDFSVCDFPYDILDIVGDNGLRHSCGHRAISCSGFLRFSESEPYGDRREIVGSPHTLSGNRKQPVRCP